MAKFTTARYPGLVLQDDKGIWARFESSTFETGDAAVIKRLRALPEDYAVVETKDVPAEPPAE